MPTFVQSDDELLWLGLLTRDTRVAASERLGIKDEVTALDFDLAVSLRLLRYDNDKDDKNKQFWIDFLGGEKKA